MNTTGSPLPRDSYSRVTPSTATLCTGKPSRKDTRRLQRHFMAWPLRRNPPAANALTTSAVPQNDRSWPEFGMSPRPSYGLDQRLSGHEADIAEGPNLTHDRLAGQCARTGE